MRGGKDLPISRLSLAVAFALLSLALVPAHAAAPPFTTIHTGAGFGAVSTLSTDAHGNIYLADGKHDAISVLSPSGRRLLNDSMPKNCGINSIAASLVGAVFAVADCRSQVYHFSPAGAALPPFPRLPLANGVATDGLGHVYVSYGSVATANGLVEYGSDGTMVRTIKLPGVRVAWAFAFDRSGNLYLSSVGGLLKLSPAGRVTQRWGTNVVGIIPSQPTVDPLGNVYSLDQYGNVIAISPSGRLGIIVRHGRAPWNVRNAVALAVVAGKFLVVAQNNPTAIKEFSLSGTLQKIFLP